MQATDNLGLTTSSSLRASLTINVQVPGDAFPDTTINPTGTVNGVQVLHLNLAGTASDDVGVSAVRVTIVDQDTSLYLQPNGTLARRLRAARYDAREPGRRQHGVVEVGEPAIAGELRGHGDRVRHLRSAGSVVDGGAPPGTRSIRVTCRPPSPRRCCNRPTAPRSPTASILVSGRLEDDQQIAQAQVAIRNGLGQYMSSTGTFTSTSVELPDGVPERARARPGRTSPTPRR